MKQTKKVDDGSSLKGEIIHVSISIGNAGMGDRGVAARSLNGSKEIPMTSELERTSYSTEND